MWGNLFTSESGICTSLDGSYSELVRMVLTLFLSSRPCDHKQWCLKSTMSHICKITKCYSKRCIFIFSSNISIEMASFCRSFSNGDNIDVCGTLYWHIDYEYNVFKGMYWFMLHCHRHCVFILRSDFIPAIKLEIL